VYYIGVEVTSSDSFALNWEPYYKDEKYYFVFTPNIGEYFLGFVDFESGPTSCKTVSIQTYGNTLEINGVIESNGIVTLFFDY